MGELGFCHLADLFKAVNVQLLTDITTDGGLPLWFVRMLHNKLTVGVFLSSRCYFQYLDPAQIVTLVSPILLPFTVYAFIAKKSRKILLTFILIMPLVFIFTLKSLQLGSKIYLYKGIFLLIAFWGFMKLNWKIQGFRSRRVIKLWKNINNTRKLRGNKGNLSNFINSDRERTKNNDPGSAQL